MNFVWGYLPLIQKDCVTHMNGLLKKTLRILIYVFNWIYFMQCLISFSSFSLHLCL